MKKIYRGNEIKIQHVINSDQFYQTHWTDPWMNVEDFSVAVFYYFKMWRSEEMQ